MDVKTTRNYSGHLGISIQIVFLEQLFSLFLIPYLYLRRTEIPGTCSWIHASIEGDQH